MQVAEVEQVELLLKALTQQVVMAVVEMVHAQVQLQVQMEQPTKVAVVVEVHT